MTDLLRDLRMENMLAFQKALEKEVNIEKEYELCTLYAHTPKKWIEPKE